MSVTYAAQYRDGTIVEDLDFEEGVERFEEALGTDNPCTVYPWPLPNYNPP